MTPRSRTGAFCVRTAVSSCLCFCACPCPSIASPFPVPHGPSVFYQDHAPLGAPEPGGGSGSLHDHRICPPVLGGSLPEEVSSHLVLMPLQMPPPHVLLPIHLGLRPLGTQRMLHVLCPYCTDTHAPVAEGQDTSPPVSSQAPGAAAPTVLGSIPGTSSSILLTTTATRVPQDS